MIVRSWLARATAHFDRACYASTCLLLLGACAASTPPAQSETSPATPSAPIRVEKLTAPLRVQDVGFETPEGVLYDARADLYLVSNIAGAARERDDRAFISRVRPDGSIAALKWIDAAQPSVELHAPKGMALSVGVLYVADIDRVRKFDSATGKPLGDIAVPGATFLHDVTVAADTSLYVSDSGLGDGLSPSETDGIYHISTRGLVERVASGKQLGQPSGLAATERGLLVVSFGSGELYRVDAQGQRTEIERATKGSLDGLALLEDHVYVSSWEGAAVYERTSGGFVERIAQLHAPAHLAIDARRRRLLVTHYEENALSIHQL
jgi:sugar lactone lactonase YvrE